MTDAGAERAITVSALSVAGIYAYRRLTEGSAPPAKGKSKAAQLAGQGSPPPVGVFITAWGFTFLVLSVVASVSPPLGGTFAILIAVADALGNTDQVAKDVNKKLGTAPGGKNAPQDSRPAAQPPAESLVSP